MKKPYKQKTVKVVKESDALAFEEHCTTILKEHQATPEMAVNCTPEGEFMAVFVYEETVFPEDERTIVDDFHDQGIRYVCEQCPHLQMDGDKRKKWFPCKFAEYGTSSVDREACEYFYKMLQQGKIVPRF